MMQVAVVRAAPAGRPVSVRFDTVTPPGAQWVRS